MKILKKNFLIFIVAFIVTFCVGYVFVSIFAKNIIKDQIKNQLHLNADIASVSLGLPLSVDIHGFELESLAKIQKITVTPSIAGFLSGKIILNKVSLIRPQITLQRNADGSFNLPQLPQGGKNPVLIAGLFIKDGMVSVTDKRAKIEPFVFSITNINIKIYKAGPLPYPISIKYALSALLPSRPGTKEAEAKGSGTIDWSHKNMRGDFKISDIDVMFFRPYLGAVISSQEDIRASLAYFDANLSAENNDLLIKCRLNVKNLSPQKEAAPVPEETQAPQEKPSPEALATLGMGLLKNPQGEIVLEFDIRTKLDNPRLDRISLKGSVFQNILQNALENPEKTKDTIKSIGEQIKKQVEKIEEGDIQELKEQGKELEKTFKEIFRDNKE